MKHLKIFILIVLIVIAIFGSCVGFAINSMFKTVSEEEKMLVNMPIDITQVKDALQKGL